MTSISLPVTTEDAVSRSGEFRAGGTDIQERVRSRVMREPLVDLGRVNGLADIAVNEEGATIGAMVRLAAFGRHAEIAARYSGLVAPARTLATPQIREMATMGGVLLQRTRCWYYRHPALRCLKNGGDTCLAREGNHHFGVCFDQGPCVHPHPSSMGMAMLAYDASVELHDGSRRSIVELYGDGSDPRRDHTLPERALLVRIHLPRPTPHERTAYFRVMSREWAEWPTVEVLARLVMAGDTIERAAIAVGGVANTPLRLPSVERALAGQRPTRDVLERAAKLAEDGASPLPGTRYKVGMTSAAVLEALERATA